MTRFGGLPAEWTIRPPYHGAGPGQRSPSASSRRRAAKRRRNSRSFSRPDASFERSSFSSRPTATSTPATRKRSASAATSASSAARNGLAASDTFGAPALRFEVQRGPHRFEHPALVGAGPIPGPLG